MAGQHLTEQGFIGAKAVECRGIEHRDASVQCRQQHPLALLPSGRFAIGMAEIHAAQADGADLEGADLSCLHPPIVPA